MNKLRLPIGISDFKKVRTQDFTLVDKSLLIRDVIDEGAEVLLLTRPRRFGKTLNQSMLYYYFSSAEQDTAQLFDGLKIQQAGEQYAKHQGQYPTISITLKDVKSGNFEEAYGKIASQIADCYRKFRYLLAADTLLGKEESARFQRILDEKAQPHELERSLYQLTEWLYKYHDKPTILLIDEYDTPIHAAYLGSYYTKMIEFMRGLMGSALKDNRHLYKGVLTGILRVAKEGLFSGLNNLKVYSFLDRRYGDYFGFTEDEVAALCDSLKPSDDMDAVKQWYNGYYIEELVLYNPWSILSYLDSGGKLAPYWVNTSDNALIQELITGTNVDVQTALAELMQGKTVEEVLDPYTNLHDGLANDTMTILSLLYMSGYLNAIPKEYKEPIAMPSYILRIPNKEVASIYEQTIKRWLSNGHGGNWLQACLGNLQEGRIDRFADNLQEIAQNIFSYHDVKGRTPETFYHAFLLGLLVSLQSEYTILSNREAGAGRYDIALLPKDPNRGQKGIIFELKKTSDASEAHLEKTAEDALEQISDRGYHLMAEAQNIKEWLYLGVAFSGKALKVAYNK